MDIDALWDFGNPEQSEQRFRDAQKGATAEDAQLLQTQVARTYSLRREFETARTLLDEIADAADSSNAELETRYAIELGRTYASGAHEAATLSPDDVTTARALYLKAYQCAKSARLDSLAIDALHMMAFVDTEPAEQLHWAQEALAVVAGSSQPAALKWEASLLNNRGYALHHLGRFDEALSDFQAALRLREQQADAWAIHVAHWMVAWTLRALGRIDEALEIQLRLEGERADAGEPDASVFEELAVLYERLGDSRHAAFYATKVARSE